jgi:hypothetical protein
MTTTYVLRNKLTGYFFNGTNFSSEEIISATNPAQILNGEPDQIAIRQIWGSNTQIIVITEEQIETLKKSEELEVRYAEHRSAGFKAISAKVRGAHHAAMTRLGKRATELARSVYCNFPRIGSAA